MKNQQQSNLLVCDNASIASSQNPCVQTTEHPEGKIILCDGRILDCYPAENESKAHTPETEKTEQKLFTDNAFYLLANKERILSDSRMFLCPLPIDNHLAITGTLWFEHPTLGVYIEWWESVPGSKPTDADGHPNLVYRIAGSPLSGMNHCSAVDETGTTRTMSLTPFKDHWRPFKEINTRYTDAKRLYQSYPLAEVLRLLHQED